MIGKLSKLNLYDLSSMIMIICLISFQKEKYIFLSGQFLFIFIMLIKIIKSNKMHFSIYIIWSFLFVIWCLTTYIWAYYPQNVLINTVQIFQVLVIGYMLLNYIDSIQKFYYIINAIIFASIVLLFRLLISTPLNFWGTTRVGESLGYNSNTIGMIFSYSTLTITYLSRLLKNKKILLLNIPFIIVGFLTGSRKAFLIILIGICLLLILGSNNIFSLIKRIIIVTVFVIIVYYAVMKIDSLYNVIGIRIEKFFNLFFDDKEVDSSTSTRLTLIRTAYSIFEKHPILGVGLDNFKTVSGYGSYAHNNYMELLSSVGLVGTLIYYSLPIYILIYSLIKKIKGSNQHDFILTVIICILIIDFALVSYWSELNQLFIVLITSQLLILKNSHTDIIEVNYKKV